MKEFLKYNIKEIFGENLIVEDAIIIRNRILKDFNDYNIIAIDFEGVNKIPQNFFSTMIVPIILTISKEDVYAKLSFLNVKKLEELNRVFFGTSNIKIH